MAKTHLTAKQIEIIKLLYNYRFLNRIQIQAFLNHKSKYRINIWLKDLTEKNLIGRIYSRSYKDNSIPAIYYLRAGSIKALQQIQDKVLVNQIYQEKYRSRRFIDKSMFIAEMYFSLNKYTESHNQKLSFYTKTVLIEGEYFTELNPSAYFEVKRPGRTKLRAMVEVIDEKTPRFALRHRLKDYDDYAVYYFKHRPGELLQALFVCPDNFIKKFIDKYCQKEYPDDAEYQWIQPYVTTRNKIGELKIY